MPFFAPVTGPGPASHLAPTAVFSADPVFGVVGSTVRLDGSASSSPTGAALSFSWRFIEWPVGSRAPEEGFRNAESDGSIVVFSPDVVGEYTVTLAVHDGSYESAPAVGSVSVRVSLVPHGRGVVPDGKFVWSYLRDVWRDVRNREVFETLWSALIQITGSELQKLYEIDFNKSISTIQDRVQRRWLSYELPLQVDSSQATLRFGDRAQGTGGSSERSPSPTRAIVPSGSSTELLVVEGSVRPSDGPALSVLSSLGPTNVGGYSVVAANSTRPSYTVSPALPAPTADLVASLASFHFVFRSKSWTAFATFVPGQYIRYPAGPNAGIYKIVSVTGFAVTVDVSPPSYSDATTSLTYKADVHSPLDFSAASPAVRTTDVLHLDYSSSNLRALSKLGSGTLVVFGGRGTVLGDGSPGRESGSRAYEAVRVSADGRSATPVVSVTTVKPAPANQAGQDWRVSNTLRSASQDFEALGVRAGDRVAFEVARLGSGASAEVTGFVTGSSGKALSFEFTDTAPVPGEPVDENLALALALGFGIGGVSTDPNGEYVLAGEALLVKQELESGAWASRNRGRDFGEQRDVVVRGASYRFRAKRVDRASAVPVHGDTVSIPVLQEYVKRPETVSERDGQFFATHRGRDFPIPGNPVILAENADFTVRGRDLYRGDLRFEPGTNRILTSGTDFVDLGVVAGDELVIEKPRALAGTYTVAAVVTQDEVILSTPVPSGATPVVTARVRLRRSFDGALVRFSPGTLDPLRLPNRLWAEVTYLGNDAAVESNFGLLVGLTRKEVEDASSGLQYRQAVTGLMYAYANGPSLGNVRTGVSVLVGLPFSEHRGIVRDVDNSYRKDLDGTPLYGRILVEDLGDAGNPTGVVRPYTYPIDTESPDLSGLDDNPATGVPYIPGDTVERYALLGKGVSVEDWVSGDLPANSIQKFHSLKIRINDNVFDPGELSLVSKFLRSITPAHIKAAVGVLQQFQDNAGPDESLGLSVVLGGGLVDYACLCVPAAQMLDSRSPEGIRQVLWDAHQDEPEVTMYIRVRSGSDAQPIDGTLEVQIPAAGVLNPRVGEVFESPLTRSGDLLHLTTGKNAGLYGIDYGSTTDGSVFADGTTPPAPSAGEFTGETGVRYAILRPVKGYLLDNVAVSTVAANSQITITGGGLRNVGVAPGDFVSIRGIALARKLFRVREVIISTGSWKILDVTPTPSATGSGNASVVRFQTASSDIPYGPFSITGAGTNFFTTVSTVYDQYAPYVQPGDYLEVVSDGTRLVLANPLNKSLTHTLAVGVYSVRFVRKDGNHRSTRGDDHAPVFLDQTPRFDPHDPLELALVEGQARASCTAASGTVTLQQERTTVPISGPSAVDPEALGIRPGDFLVLTSGTNGGVDVGFGPGVYPIMDVSTTNVTVDPPLTATESCSYKLVRRFG